MAKTDQFHLRMEPALKARVIAEAAKRHILPSALVSLIISEWLMRIGAPVDSGAPNE